MNAAPSPFSARETLPALAGGGAAVFAADFLLRGAEPGLSLALFAGFLALLIAANRSRAALRAPASLALAALLAGALAGTAFDLCFTNVCVVLALLAAFAGETAFVDRPTLWARWLSQAGALLQAPGRLLWGAGALLRLGVSSPSGNIRVLAWIVGVLFPTFFLLALFASILGSGNAVLGNWIARFGAALWEWLKRFDLSFGRIAFWIFIGAVSLALLRPKRTGRLWWGWTEGLRRFSAPAPERSGAAFWRSALMLAALNGLFFAANGIDAIYLWARLAAPAGTSYARFVHEGTGQLIAATVLAAAVLIVLFNQDEALTRHPALRAGALAWIAQNLFLLSSVALRLKLYVDAYDLTEQRLSVLLFLILVATGFGLLALKIVREKPLAWLVAANALAVFTLFYAVQFLPLGEMTASYNVSRWEREPGRKLDLPYIGSLGSEGWEALRRVSEAPERLESAEAFRLLESARAGEVPKDWRSWQGRRARDLRFLRD